MKWIGLKYCYIKYKGLLIFEIPNGKYEMGNTKWE